MAQRKKGERIQEKLLDPERHDVAATEWLLLYTIWKAKKASISMIQDEITKLWKKIKVRNPSFYLLFPKSNDGHNLTSLSINQELIKFYEIGIVNLKEGQNDIALWSLTEKGIKVLNEWWPRVQKRIPSVCFRRLIVSEI